MKIAGLGLLLSGWGIVMFALAILPRPGERIIFVVAGFLVELLGLTLMMHAHRILAGGGE